jgi:hypothetical protein
MRGREGFLSTMHLTTLDGASTLRQRKFITITDMPNIVITVPTDLQVKDHPQARLLVHPSPSRGGAAALSTADALRCVRPRSQGIPDAHGFDGQLRAHWPCQLEEAPCAQDASKQGTAQDGQVCEPENETPQDAQLVRLAALREGATSSTSRRRRSRIGSLTCTSSRQRSAARRGTLYCCPSSPPSP